MKNIDIKIFFDESGKGDNTPTLMGGLSIPASIYDATEFRVFSHKLKA